MKNNFTTYISPFSQRYGSDEMKQIFSMQNKYATWRRIWVALAKAQHLAGLVSKRELNDLIKQQDALDIDRAMEIEKDTRHDVVAAVREFAEKAKIGGGKIHLGATSMDIVDNQEMLQMKLALFVIEKKLLHILELFSKKIEMYADTACMGYTHLQAAEPTTLGYRFAFYAQDVLIDLSLLRFVTGTIKGKGLKGAVGTAASYSELLRETNMSVHQLEASVMASLNLDPVLIASQVQTRKFDYLVLSVLASIASTLAKFAGDVRILQSSGFNELQEPFATSQVGSSAMPFKRNPINSEKICSLSRYMCSLPAVALENATLSYLERTIDDSANKRVIISESFLAVDEMLKTTEYVLSGLIVHEKKIAYNLAQFAPFAASEAVLMIAVKHGANRQEIHELLRSIALVSWDAIQKGEKNPMERLLLENQVLKEYISQGDIQKALRIENHIGTAPQRARELIKEIKKVL